MADIRISSQSVEVTDVADVVVTTIEQDPDAGDYVRDIRIFGAAVSEGGSQPLLLQVRIRASARDPLQIISPQSEF
jgi:hypothetical protein